MLQRLHLWFLLQPVHARWMLSACATTPGWWALLWMAALFLASGARCLQLMHHCSYNSIWFNCDVSEDGNGPSDHDGISGSYLSSC